MYTLWICTGLNLHSFNLHSVNLHLFEYKLFEYTPVWIYNTPFQFTLWIYWLNLHCLNTFIGFTYWIYSMNILIRYTCWIYLLKILFEYWLTLFGRAVWQVGLTCNSEIGWIALVFCFLVLMCDTEILCAAIAVNAWTVGPCWVARDPKTRLWVLPSDWT